MPLEILVIVILGIIVSVWLIVRQQNLRLRQMQHRERLAALERRPAGDEATHLEGDPPMPDNSMQWKDPETYLTWARYSTLGLAFLLMFGGAGMLTAFLVIQDAEMRKLWSIGLIPIMTGAGLFLFWAMTTFLMRSKDD